VVKNKCNCLSGASFHYAACHLFMQFTSQPSLSSYSVFAAANFHFILGSSKACHPSFHYTQQLQSHRCFFLLSAPCASCLAFFSLSFFYFLIDFKVKNNSLKRLQKLRFSLVGHRAESRCPTQPKPKLQHCQAIVDSSNFHLAGKPSRRIRGRYSVCSIL